MGVTHLPADRGGQMLLLGGVSLGMALVLMAVSLGLFPVFLPLLLASVVCGIVAVVDRRLLGGLVLLAAALVIPAAFTLVSTALRHGWFLPTATPPSPATVPVSGPPRVSADVDRLEVTAARLFIDTTVDPGEPVLEVAVRNGTTRRISHAYFVATSATPELVPVATQAFDYAIPDTLGPGESTTWQFSLARDGPWARAAARTGLVLVISVTRIDTADGDALVREP